VTSAAGGAVAILNREPTPHDRLAELVVPADAAAISCAGAEEARSMSQAPEVEKEQEQEPEAKGVIERLAGRGEDAFRRLVGEIDKNPRLHDALGRLERIEKSVLNRLNIASLDEVNELREEVARLEKRLAKVETAAARADKS
jgi:hypothetical protein